MIPHRLRLRNFMCYREEQALDFSGLHLACLTGDNGHGKSALLDAITWALWGRARARRDDELIALGKDITEMWVEFEFGLAGQRYRVWRQRSKRGRGQSDLHFYVWHDAGESWQLLDEGGLVERQAQIIRSLRMDYDTFVNSAFLLQGRADSFTVKTASERKQILADILGLARYDLYEQRAKEEAQARRDRAGLILGEQRAIENDLARRPEYEAQLATARHASLAAVDALRRAEGEQAKGREAVQNLRSLTGQLADLRSRLARAERDLAELRGQLATAQARQEGFERVLAQRAEIEAGWAALQAARAEDAAWNDRLLRHTQLQECLMRAQRGVDQARAALEGDERRLADRAADLAHRIAQGREQERLLAEAQAALARLAEQQARRDVIAAGLRDLGERAAALKVESDRLKVEGQAIRDKIEMMEAAETASCPLCQQPLTAEHRDAMLAELKAERQTLADRFRSAGAELKALAEQRAALEAEDTTLARDLRARDARQRQAAQAEAAVAEGQAAQAEAERVAAASAALAQRLATGDYASAERAALAQAQADIAANGYDATTHQAVRGRAAQWEAFDARYNRQLLPALDGITEARGRVEQIAATLARRSGEIAADQAERGRLETAVAGLPQLEAALTQANGRVEQAAEAERRARQSEGAAMQRLAALDALAERGERLRAELERLNAEISIFQELREAFGKKGVQALAIESAIPEVEDEANRLLARMTEGRMSLRLETQREKVTGGVAETLDIILADELGARPFEMFSGGESFRANLALRIAISKLLARRAGAQLQTLVIDEGFGSQDAKGRDLVVEAISSIQDDFARILVVTHIEELKDLFPARIDVVKTAEGSRVSIG